VTGPSAVQDDGISLLSGCDHAKDVVGTKDTGIILWIAGDIIDCVGDELVRIGIVDVDEGTFYVDCPEILL